MYIKLNIHYKHRKISIGWVEIMLVCSKIIYCYNFYQHFTRYNLEPKM